VNPISLVQDLQGPALIGLIAALLFIEEVGVPLPFAPGDLVLALGGIAIAGGRVNAAILVTSAALATLAGAILGRELFALLGWQRLMRVAEPLHARKPLERAAALLHRSGWRAVFTARLVPGLRVHTTQVAGVTRMSRLTFVEGLVPATALYIGAFIGLGAAFGRPVLALIHDAERQALLALALIVAALALFLLTRAPLRRGVASLQAAGWTGPLRFSLDSIGLTLILASLGLNFTGHALAQSFGLPLFLDSTGTILAGVIGGPWVGASVGVFSNLLAGNTVDPIASPYALVSFMVGFAAGLSRYFNWRSRASGWISLWLVCFAIAAFVSTPLNFLISGGQSGVHFGDSIYAALNNLHVPRVLAALIGEAAVDLPDKLVTVVAALLIAQGFSEPRPAAASRGEVNLRNALTFVVHSPHWGRTLLAAAGCLFFFWLIVPLLLLIGYIVQIVREVREGRTTLPRWDRRWRKIGDGFKITLALLLWVVPGLLLSIPAAIVGASKEVGEFPAAAQAIAGIVAGVGSAWLLLVNILEPPIISQYIDHGFAGAMNPARVFGRARQNVGLSMVIGALVVVLTTVGVIGLALVVIGVLITFPYASFVGAYLVGVYARLTVPDSAPAISAPSGTPSIRRPPGPVAGRLES
jgi:energy-coupling factor transport system substrate-specific component